MTSETTPEGVPPERLDGFALMISETAAQSCGGAAFVILTTKVGLSPMHVASAGTAMCSESESPALRSLNDALRAALQTWLEKQGYETTAKEETNHVRAL